MTAVEQHLLALIVVANFLVQVIDGKALAVSRVSKDPDVGYGRGAGMYHKGYKFHVWGTSLRSQCVGVGRNERQRKNAWLIA